MLETKKTYVMVKLVKVEPTTLAEFKSTVKEENENLKEAGYSVTCNGIAQFLSEEQFEKHCHEIKDMKFAGAAEWLKLGFKATRNGWMKGAYIKLDQEGFHIVDEKGNKYFPSLCDIAGNDWRIVE